MYPRWEIRVNHSSAVQVKITVSLEVVLNSLVRGTNISRNMLTSYCSEEVRRRKQEVPLKPTKLHEVPSQNSVICEHKKV